MLSSKEETTETPKLLFILTKKGQDLLQFQPKKTTVFFIIYGINSSVLCP